MCGICGVLHFDGQRAEALVVTAMRDTMTPRGPDDYGTWCEGQVGLGHRRLSILDLSSAAHQPMESGDGRAVIVFNGEIYNYRTLRAELSAKGETFRSTSDTEVILSGYLRWGERVIEELDGIFAFAIWDRGARTLLLARDRMGVKPLYYARTSGSLWFASEVKAIKAASPSCTGFRREALFEQLVFRDVAGERTLFENVARLSPGGVLVASGEGVRQRRYWNLQRGPERTETLNPNDLEVTLRATVESQMMSDVPVGTLCSGGLDSSLVTAMAQRERGGGLHTFSVGFPLEPCDETTFSRTVADHLRTTHHVLNASSEAFSADLERLAEAHDEPLSHPNSILIYQVCRLAKESGVTVLLTGEGADELFCGYRHTAALKGAGKVRRLLAKAGCSRLGDLLGRVPGRIGKRCAPLCGSDDEVLLYATAFLEPAIARQLMGEPGDLSLAHRERVLDECRGQSLLERMRWMDLHCYLPPILLRQDKMSMAASVESRVPMLGNSLVEMAARTTAEGLVKGNTGKQPLRDVGYRWLPAEIIDRRKVGFAMPLGKWMRECRALAERLSAMAEPRSPLAQHLDMRLVGRWVQEHREAKVDHSEALWILLSLFLWLQAHGKESHATD